MRSEKTCHMVKIWHFEYYLEALDLFSELCNVFLCPTSKIQIIEIDKK